MILRKKEYASISLPPNMTVEKVRTIVRDQVSSRSTAVGLIKTWTGAEDVVVGGVTLKRIHLQAMIPSAPMRQTFALKVGGRIVATGDRATKIRMHLYPAPIVYVANTLGIAAVIFAIMAVVLSTQFLLLMSGVLAVMTAVIYVAGLSVASYEEQGLDILARWMETFRSKLNEPA